MAECTLQGSGQYKRTRLSKTSFPASMLPPLSTLGHALVSAHPTQPHNTDEVSFGQWFERELTAIDQEYKNGATKGVAEEKASALFEKVWNDQTISIEEFEQAIDDFEHDIGVKTSIAQWLRAKMKIWKEALRQNEMLTRDRYVAPFRQKWKKPEE